MGGIRTPGAFQHTRFPGVHNQPLCHPSKRWIGILQHPQLPRESVALKLRSFRSPLTKPLILSEAKNL